MKAIVFPGQGSQERGMGVTLFDLYPELTQIADNVLGYSIKELCLQDPRKELNQTKFTQPAIYVVNALSYYKHLEESGIKPQFVAGHSLGEFNALLAAGCFSFETGLRLVKKRGELMAQATVGGMAAILNASREKVEQVLKDNSFNTLEVANHNTMTQVVISGDKTELAKAQPFFEADNMLYYPLNTSGAFHSRFMQDAQQQFSEYVKSFNFAPPEISIISNVTALPYENDQIVDNITTQISSTVRWVDSVCYLIEQGVTDFCEVGYNNVLAKIIAKIQRELEAEGKLNVATSRSDGQSILPAANADTAPFRVAQDKVSKWNHAHAVGAKFSSTLSGYDQLTTKTKALVLFGHRAAVYMEGYNGYFSLDELVPN